MLKTPAGLNQKNILKNKRKDVNTVEKSSDSEEEKILHMFDLKSKKTDWLDSKNKDRKKIYFTA